MHPIWYGLFLFMPPSFQAIYDQIWNLNFSSTLIVYRYYESLWLFMSFNLHSLRNGVIVCIYKSQTVVYGSLITDLGITDSDLCWGIWYKYNLSQQSNGV